MRTTAGRGVSNFHVYACFSAAPESARVPAGIVTVKRVAKGSVSAGVNDSVVVPSQRYVPRTDGSIFIGSACSVRGTAASAVIGSLNVAMMRPL